MNCIFERRTALKDSDQMLEALLPRIRSFRRAHRIRDVPDERNSLLARFVGNREHCLARNQRLQLDEVRAPSLQIIDGSTAIFWSRNRNRTGKARLRTVEHRPR